MNKSDEVFKGALESLKYNIIKRIKFIINFLKSFNKFSK